MTKQNSNDTSIKTDNDENRFYLIIIIIFEFLIYLIYSYYYSYFRQSNSENEYQVIDSIVK